MELKRRGSVWKEQMDYFFFSLLANEHPGLPLLMKPPHQARMRTWAAGGYLRHGHRGCGSAPNSGLRDQRTSANPRSRPTALHSRNHGGSGGSFGRTAHHRLVHLPRAAAGKCVAAPGGDLLPMRAPESRKPASRLPPSQPSHADCRDPCPIAAAGIACPPPVPRALLVQTLPSAPAPGREQRLGRGGRLPRTIAEAFSYLRGKKNPLCLDSTPGGRRGHFCTVRLYSSHKENFPS